MIAHALSLALLTDCLACLPAAVAAVNLTECFHRYMDADFDEWTALVADDELAEALEQEIFQIRTD